MHSTGTIHVVAPAGTVDKTDLDSGALLLEKYFAVHTDSAVFSRLGFLAGDDSTRLQSLQNALDSKTGDAIIAARGGYGTSRILDALDFSNVCSSPKWIVGSSDLTALLIHLWATFGLVTIHGPMVARFSHGDPRDVEKLIALLTGQPWTSPPELVGWCNGSATGPLIGGNLTMLSHMAGTINPSCFDNCILFLEDVTEAPYRLDRSLVQLRRAGFLNNISGVVLGKFFRCNPGTDGTSVEDVLRHHFCLLDIPVVAEYPAAHDGRNWPFLHGQQMSLTVSGENEVLLQANQLKG